MYIRRYLLFGILLTSFYFFSCRYDKQSLLEDLRLGDTLKTPEILDTRADLTAINLLKNSHFTDWRVLGDNHIGAFCHVSIDVDSVKGLTAGNYFMRLYFKNDNFFISKIDSDNDPQSSYRFFRRFNNLSSSIVENPVGYSINGQSIKFCIGRNFNPELSDTMIWDFTNSTNKNYNLNSYLNAKVIAHELYSGGYLVLNSEYGFTLFPIEGLKVNWDSPYQKNGFYARDLEIDYINRILILANLSDGSMSSNDPHCHLLEFDPDESQKFKSLTQFLPDKPYERFILNGNLLHMMNENELWWSLDDGNTRNVVAPIKNYRSLNVIFDRYGIENGKILLENGNEWKAIENYPIEGTGHIIQCNSDRDFIVGSEDGYLYKGGFLTDLKKIF